MRSSLRAWLWFCVAWWLGLGLVEAQVIRAVYSRPGGYPLKLDLYRAPGTAPQPVVLWLHGGGWKYGWKGFGFFARGLTRYGFAVATVNYRLSGRAVYPAQYEDTQAALAWLRQHAAEHGLDAQNLFVAGASAGGHLAALAAVTEGRPHIRAAMAMYPPTDLTGFEGQDATRGYLPELLGGSVTAKYALARSGSPLHLVHAGAAPVLFFHGDRDSLVPVHHSLTMHQRLRAAGVPSRLVILARRGHGFGLDETRLQETAAWFRQFLR